MLATAAPPLTTPRDAALRRHYSDAVLAEIPRILGSLDRNPLRATYGCFDRQFWHYRTAAFPSEMYQEAVLPLAWAYATRCPNNRWHQQSTLRDWAIASLRYSARAGHADGSCDDYYPYERALGAAVFSLNACVWAYELLDVDDVEIVAGLVRRARWIAAHDESGKLTNHHALAAIALARVASIAGDHRLLRASEERVEQVLAWQNAEGWFAEYDGADPGYQTVTIGCLAEYRKLTARKDLTEPLRRACEFGRWFLHPDDSYGGEYGSRGTYHCYPHGFEFLAGESSAAADLADACLRQLAQGTEAAFDDDRLYTHRLVSLAAAYDHWSANRAAQRPFEEGTKYFSGAGLVVDRHETRHTIVSLARGGTFKHFVEGSTPVSDAGLIVKLADGRLGVSQQHLLPVENDLSGDDTWRVEVSRRLTACRFETATPLKQSVLHLGMMTVGRWARGLTRRLLQRRLITGRNELPVRLTRCLEIVNVPARRLRVTDTIELLDASTKVERMAFAVDLQAAYTAASGVFQASALQPWTDLSEHLEALNRERRVVIVRELPA
jgi:hypothetical protein